MKHSVPFLLLLCLLLAGCSLTEGNYVSVTPHLEQQNPEQQEIIRATSYAELCTALTDLIDGNLTTGIISVSDYPVGQAERHMEQAVDYACTSYPTGAYAVERITWEFGSSGGQDAFAVTISYRHSPAELARIQSVAGPEGVKNAIYSALNQCDSALVLKVIRYEDMDFAQIVEDYALRNPNMVIEIPEVSVGFYPEEGTTRIAELKFTYQTSRDSLRMMQGRVQSLFEAAKLYVDSDGEDHEKYAQLYAFLTERYDYQVETSLTPAYSLLCHGVGDSKAFATVYAAMCRSAGLDCVSVSGTRNGEPWSWNILRDGDTYFHVDLLRCMGEEAFQELADGQMEGYVWDFSAYPACGVPAGEDTEEETLPPQE